MQGKECSTSAEHSYFVVHLAVLKRMRLFWRSLTSHALIVADTPVPHNRTRRGQQRPCWTAFHLPGEFQGIIGSAWLVPHGCTQPFYERALALGPWELQSYCYYFLRTLALQNLRMVHGSLRGRTWKGDPPSVMVEHESHNGVCQILIF